MFIHAEQQLHEKVLTYTMPKDFQEIPVILFVVSVIPYFHKLQAPLILS
jgi:hypothetical protein